MNRDDIPRTITGILFSVLILDVSGISSEYYFKLNTSMFVHKHHGVLTYLISK